MISHLTPSRAAQFCASPTKAWFTLCALALVACGGGGSGSAQADVSAAANTPAPVTPAPVTPTPTTPVALSVPSDYKLVWADKFDKDGLPDASKWAYDTERNKAGWYNHELQYYSGPRLENAQVKNGRLLITARKESLSSAPDWGGQTYTSSRLITRGKAEWTYGFFEIRAKLPCGKGTWPAIWMLGSQGEWPARGELDIMEQVGKEPDRVFSTVHTTSGSGGNGKGAAIQLSDACSAFHNYQMHWTAQQVSFAVDGKAHFTYANQGTGTAQWPFLASQFLILNIAMGGDLGGPVDDAALPVTMEVDYVRVYQPAK